MISSHHPSKDLIWLWSWQLLQAVAFLHKQQICHRDISLENILLSKGDIRLMDFGQAVRRSLVVELPFYWNKNWNGFNSWQATGWRWFTLCLQHDHSLEAIFCGSTGSTFQVPAWKSEHVGNCFTTSIEVRYLGTCQGSQSSSGQLLRYFLATGKPYYRPPETYIPGSQRLQVMVPPGLSPGQVALAYTPGQDCCHLRMDLQCLQGKSNYSS